MRVADPRPTLRDLPAELRLVLAAFLVLAGAGYCAALVQVHYQSAGPGELFPGPDRVSTLYAGPAAPTRSRIEVLLESDHGPLNGTGTMRPAFTTRSRDWDVLTTGKSPDELRRLHDEREGERLALLIWVRAGADRGAYDRDDFPLGPEFAGHPITPEFLAAEGPSSRRLRVRTLIEKRCRDCHSETGREELARLFPFDTYERLGPYLQVQPTTRMSLPKLAQTTHVHLLGFAVLYGATGALFCLTTLPRPVRFAVGPLPLVAQGLDIACWWLARWEAVFAWGVVVGGALAGLGLALHIAIGLWELASPRRVADPAGAG